MTVALCSFANDDFKAAQKFQKVVASRLGFKAIYAYGPDDLSPEFKIENRETLSYERGFGYWIWKPEIILKTAIRSTSETLILYIDSGAIPNAAPEYFSRLASDDKIHLWSDSGGVSLENISWIDENVARTLSMSPEDLSAKHMMAGFVCFKNNFENRQVIETWLKLCKNPNLLRPETFPNYAPGSNLIWHRHDQALLNYLVVRKPERFRGHILRTHFSVFDKSMGGEPFVLHRRGWISNLLALKLFFVLRKFKHQAKLFLPRKLAFVLDRAFLTRKKRRTISATEQNSHKRAISLSGKKKSHDTEK